MAHIQKRGPKRWVARYEDPAGRERARSFERKIDAEKFLVSVQHQKWTNTYVDPDAGRVTFAEYADAWRTAQPHRVSTARTVRHHLHAHAFPAFAMRPLASIRTSDIQAWVTGLSTGGLAPSTVRAVFENVRAVFRAVVA